MKQKDIHIVFGKSSEGTFIHSQAFNLNDVWLICLEDVLNIGPVCDLYSDENIGKRKDLLLKIFGSHLFCDNNLVDKDLEIIKNLIENPEKIDKIFLWTGSSASEILGTARLLFHLSKFNKSIFKVDFPNIPVKNMRGDIIYPRVLTVLDLSQVNEFAKHFKLLTSEELTKWESAWEEIKSGNSMLKILDENDKIAEKDETYFDSFLESNCCDEFQLAARVVGKTLCDIDFNVGDSYLNWRLKQLFSMKRIEICGKLNKIRDYEVKLPDTKCRLWSK